MLGLHPGLGGTVRLPRLINPVEAMTMMLTGTQCARAAGEVARPRRRGDAGAARRGRRQGRGHRQAQDPRAAACSVDAAQHRARRAACSPRACARETAKKAPNEHYPAPYALIDLWEKHGGDRDAPCRRPRSHPSRGCWSRRYSQNLVRVFFLREKLKGIAGGDWTGHAACMSSAPAPWAATSPPGARGTDSPSASPT